MRYGSGQWSRPSYYPRVRSSLSDIELLLTGREALPGPVAQEQLPLFAEEDQVRDELGYVDLAKLEEERPRLALVRELSQRYRFHHWQLEYADLFGVTLPDSGRWPIPCGSNIRALAFLGGTDIIQSLLQNPGVFGGGGDQNAQIFGFFDITPGALACVAFGSRCIGGP